MPEVIRIFRFAPSPNGPLHLGHARSALLCEGLARAVDGQFLIRIEDIDQVRCTRAFEAAVLEDLRRLGLRSDRPIRRQSDHFTEYDAGLNRLRAMGLVYPSFLSRAVIKTTVEAREASGQIWPRDPDGAPLYPGTERDLSPELGLARIAAGEQAIWRLDMRRAIECAGAIDWQEAGSAGGDRVRDHAAMAGVQDFYSVAADPASWGDIVLARADIPTSYHLSVVIDDAAQGITDVVRGCDLFHATSVHRLLQTVLGLPAPRYHHHALIRDRSGRKLAKSAGDSGLGAVLARGIGRRDLLCLVDLPPVDG